MPGDANAALSTLEYHVLLSLATSPLHGYAITEAIATESDGTLLPHAGSLYRVLARLMASGVVKETDAAADGEAHPGLARRYYTLTPAGRRALAAEAARLKRTATMAEKRLGVARSRS